MSVEEDLAQQVSGYKQPVSFVLDASALDDEELHEIFREDIKRNKIRFFFPAGVNKLDLLEECRALTQLKDFDMMFDITMQMLVDKDVVIFVKNEAGEEVETSRFHVTHKDMNLRGVDFIDEYPVVVTWLTEFIAATLLKKYPVPGSSRKEPQQAPEKVAKEKKKTPMYRGPSS